MPQTEVPEPTPNRDKGAVVFVLGVLVILFLAALNFVNDYAQNVPYADDWEWVEYASGQAPVNLHWLWAQHNEHRYLVPKLVYLSILWNTGCDYRAAMRFNVILLGVVSLALVLASAHVRGRFAYTDAVFPLIFLHFGHYETVLSAFFVMTALPVLLVALFLIIVVTHPRGMTTLSALGAGVCLIALEMCGGVGLLLAPALAVWLVVALVWPRHPSAPFGGKNLCILATLLAAAFVGWLTFRGYERPAAHLPPSDWFSVALTSMQVVTTSLGPAVSRTWEIAGGALGVVTLASVILLINVLWERPGERLRAAGLLLLLAGFLCLAFGIGWGRAHLGDTAGLSARYVSFAAPSFCVLYFIWQLYSPAAVKDLAPLSLFFVAVLTYLPNNAIGLDNAAQRKQAVEAFLQDMRHNAPPDLLAGKYARFFLYPNEDELAKKIEVLQRAAVGPFKGQRSDFYARAHAVPLEPLTSVVGPMEPDKRKQNWKGRGKTSEREFTILGHGMSWDEQQGTWTTTGRNSYLEFTLPEDEHVDAIRLRFVLTSANRSGHEVRVEWSAIEDSADDGRSFAAVPETARPLRAGENNTFVASASSYSKYLPPFDPARTAIPALAASTIGLCGSPAALGQLLAASAVLPGRCCQTLPIWTHAKMGRIRIWPDTRASCRFRLEELTLLK